MLSVRDLNLSDRIGELIDAGITSFKIEGRLKDVGYIKNVVSHYRQRIDRALASRPGFCRSSVGESRPDFQPDPSKSFTRGESEYFFDGRRAGVASFDTPKSVGEFVGRVARVDGRNFTLAGPHDLAPGDGICFRTWNGLAGTNVNEVAGNRIVPNRMEGVVPGAEVFRNFDRPLFVGARPQPYAARDSRACRRGDNAAASNGAFYRLRGGCSRGYA